MSKVLLEGQASRSKTARRKPCVQTPESDCTSHQSKETHRNHRPACPHVWGLRACLSWPCAFFCWRSVSLPESKVKVWCCATVESGIRIPDMHSHIFQHNVQFPFQAVAHGKAERADPKGSCISLSGAILGRRPSAPNSLGSKGYMLTCCIWFQHAIARCCIEPVDRCRNRTNEREGMPQTQPRSRIRVLNIDDKALFTRADRLTVACSECRWLHRTRCRTGWRSSGRHGSRMAFSEDVKSEHSQQLR